MGWRNSPQYLKGIQKIRSMRPEQKAVTQTLVDELSGLYAGEDMRKQLEAMRIASQVKAQDRNVELSQKNLDLTKKAIDYRGDELDTATNLGWANIGLSGVFGLADMYRQKQEAQRYRDLIDRVYGG